MAGKKELLYDGVCYDVTQWIKKHPGGKIIEIYTDTGEDSTIAVQQLHQRSTKKVMSIMKSLPHRKLNENDIKGMNMAPEKLERHKVLTTDFLELYESLKREGYFKADPLHVLARIAELILLLCLGLHLLIAYPHNILLRIVGIFTLALGSGRTAWVIHEGGHRSLFGIPKVDGFIQSILYGVAIGLSGCYWTSQHSRHHAAPQHIQHDVDLKTLPIIAFNKRIVKHPKDGKTFFIQNQKWLFILIDTVLIGLVWKLYIHPRCCIRKGRYDELLFMTMHYMIFSYIGFLNYCIIFWMATVYLLGNIMLSHSYLDVADEPTHWVEYALTHTANVRSSYFGWVDYWMGNLNYQIEHHLFPTMPQYRNKLCRDRVKALAKKHNLKYHLYSYSEAVVKCFDNLGSVAKELGIN